MKLEAYSGISAVLGRVLAVVRVTESPSVRGGVSETSDVYRGDDLHLFLSAAGTEKGVIGLVGSARLGEGVSAREGDSLRSCFFVAETGIGVTGLIGKPSVGEGESARGK